MKVRSELAFLKKIIKKRIENSKDSAINSRFEDDKSFVDLLSKNLKINNRLENDICNNDENELGNIKRILVNRRRYQANFCHKILKFIPNCLWRYKGIQKK